MPAADASGSSPVPATRLAPSPTGALHLGNARTFLVNWVLAQQNGWRVLCRIDDLEGPRIKPGADRQALEDMAWLGLSWEEPVVYQSSRTAAYQRALERLAGAGRAYPCVCTRSQIASAGAGTEPDQSDRYPGTCRGRTDLTGDTGAAGSPPAMRLAVPEREICFDDSLLGRQCYRSPQQIGDFVIRKAGGEFGYQLATVVDDAAAGVTQVVRGQDLLASTPRQILLYEELGLAKSVPGYLHLPLIVGPDGRKLAKRHGDTRLRHLREQGMAAGQVRGLLARWSGFEPRGNDVSIKEWVDRFQLSKLPRQTVVFEEKTDLPQLPAGEPA